MGAGEKPCDWGYAETLAYASLLAEGHGLREAGPDEVRALVDILREEDIHDPALVGVSVTVTEVRLSPDLKHATCFVEPLGAGVDAAETTGHESEIIKALNAHAKFLRGRLGPKLDMKFTPDLKFRHDESFDAASHMDRLFADPRVRADLEASDDEDDQ